MKKIPFIKMHGAGNDFVFINKEDVNGSLSKALVQKIMDRHFGIGGDQLLLLSAKGKKASPRLDIYNSDGSMAEMCGNGVRAVAFYLMNQKGFKKDFTILTKAGEIGIGIRQGKIDVDMGEPILEGRKIPVDADGEIVDHPLIVDGSTYRIHSVSMGNPHCVIFVDNVDAVPLETIGPRIEHHPFFPNRVNVEFVEIKSRTHLKSRIWERGAGITLACGTGACAVGVAAARAGKAERAVKIDVPGGQLRVRWADNNHVFLSGPAEVSYKGEFYV